MTHSDFNQILSSITGLSAAQMRRLADELETRLGAMARKRATSAKPARTESEETAFDVANRAGLIGCIKGSPRSPSDLSTNPKHMEGFGRD